MEAIVVIIVLVIGLSIYSNLRNSKDKVQISRKDVYFGPPQLKIENDLIPDTEWSVKKIMFRGRLPNIGNMDVSYALSAFDITDGVESKLPVISLIDEFREQTTTCFHHKGHIGKVRPESAITSWVNIGAIIPELIQTPYSGNRIINIVFRLFDTNENPDFIGGMLVGKGGITSSQSLSFNHNFKEKGYEEASRDRTEAQAISLKIGIAVAMSDGSLHDSEGKILKNWILKEVSPFTDNQRDDLKKVYNQALKEGYAEAASNSLSLDSLTARLAQIGDKKTKYGAVELCLDVMAADGVADPSEMKIIYEVSDKLGLEMSEIEKMREKVTLNLSTELTSEDGLEALVGIDPAWPAEKKRKHLSREFQKWSNRLNSLDDAAEKESAQSMLDHIATLRSKYG